MKRLSTLFNFFGGAAFTLFFVSQFAFKSNAKQNMPVDTGSVPTEFRAPKLPQSLSFAGEAVPLDRWDVQERLDRELLVNSFSPANILYLLKLSNRYFRLFLNSSKPAACPMILSTCVLQKVTSKAVLSPKQEQWGSGSL
jgi:hypothetical protein